MLKRLRITENAAAHVEGLRGCLELNREPSFVRAGEMLPGKTHRENPTWKFANLGEIKHARQQLYLTKIQPIIRRVVDKAPFCAQVS